MIANRGETRGDPLATYAVETGCTPFLSALEQRRCLHRLWLSMPNSRALPEDHGVLWGEVAAGARRGGIVQP